MLWNVFGALFGLGLKLFGAFSDYEDEERANALRRQQIEQEAEQARQQVFRAENNSFATFQVTADPGSTIYDTTHQNAMQDIANINAQEQNMLAQYTEPDGVSMFLNKLAIPIVTSIGKMYLGGVFGDVSKGVSDNLKSFFGGFNKVMDPLKKGIGNFVSTAPTKSTTDVDHSASVAPPSKQNSVRTSNNGLTLNPYYDARQEVVARSTIFGRRSSGFNLAQTSYALRPGYLSSNANILRSLSE